MTATLSKPPRNRRSARPQPQAASHTARSGPRRTRTTRLEQDRPTSLARYIDGDGRPREVITRPGFAGSVLVVDRDADTLADRRLVAHLGADEPQENAAIVCDHYLEGTQIDGVACRLLSGEDLRRHPFAEEEITPDWLNAQRACSGELVDRNGREHRLALVQTGMSIPELRWRRSSRGETQWRTVSMRDAIAALERYEPVRTLSRSALARHRDDPDVSVTVLRTELERVLESAIVLNRGLRDAVLAAIGRQEVSMSEIATRCGRVKRDKRGNASGETSWLARRLGLLPEGGHQAPTPWIHSDVLGLICRSGLGVSPREVEL
ncbi:MAG: hypothetical protein JWN81_1221 [Solirubrobacterales bacterium]|nr:hypothetical protein [Solirubrobacterales bacterium]